MLERSRTKEERSKQGQTNNMAVNATKGMVREKVIRCPPIHKLLHTRLVYLVLLTVRVEDIVVRERLVFTENNLRYICVREEYRSMYMYLV